MMHSELDPAGDAASAEEPSTEPLSEETASPEGDPEWAPLLQHLLDARGFDFRGYKPASLARRIRKRMEALRVEDFAGYQDYLQSHSNEFAALFNTILINVTGFFRDLAVWEAVRSIAIPQMIANKGPEDPIRAWSAGCASGEEAYTIAMLLAEGLGMEQFHERVKVYATDVDEDALDTARQAAYTGRQVEGVPPELLSRYFEQVDGLHFFRKDLRRHVIFGRHDLISDAPISRVDLLTCRNTLMYLNSETQAQVLSRLHFALNPGGFLLLGRAETLMAYGQSFAPVDLKQRLSQKRTSASMRDSAFPRRNVLAPRSGSDLDSQLQSAALESNPVAQLVVDSAGNLVMVNDRARALFGLRPADVGRPLRDLQVSYRPIELRSLIEKAEVDRRPVAVKEIESVGSAGETRWLDLQVAPLIDVSGGILGTVLTFTDVTAYRRLQRELEESHQELETAHEELQSTNEELETTNEELQSTVEELETTNEELQSTNEELETMNEELQSTNEELQTMNDELRQRGDDLNSANSFLQSVLTSLKGGVVVVDRELKVLAWNLQAQELWGLRESEVNGHQLLNLDIGLPLDQLKPLIRSCLNGEIESDAVTLQAINRRGRSIRCEITCTPLRGWEDERRGAILIMEEALDV